VRVILTRWPTIVAVACAILNVDLVIMPAVSIFWGIDGWGLFWVAAFSATAEVLYWRWYAGWLGRMIRKAGPSKRTALHFVSEGFLGRLKKLGHKAKSLGLDLRDWWGEHAVDHMEVNTPIKKKLLDDAEYIVRNTHVLAMYPLMIGFGAVPFGWAVGIALTRVIRAPFAFPLLLATNALKTWGLGVAYLWAPLWLKLLIWAILIGLGIFQVVRIVRKNGTVGAI